MSDYTPSVDEIVLGKTHIGDNYWRELTEAEVRRGIAQVRAETWDEAIQAVFDWWSSPEDERGVIVNPYGVHPADRLMQEIEKEADQ